MSEQPVPFTLHVPDAAIAELRERLPRTRFPDQAPGELWAHGTDAPGRGSDPCRALGPTS